MAFIRKALTWVLLERPVKHKSTDELVARFQKSQEIVLERYEKAAENADNHGVMTHIIGIERWAQQRVRCAAGADFVDEEYDVYRPAKDTPWQDLKDQFMQTRQESIDLVKTLTDAQLATPVRHNDFGKITARAWLGYMTFHSNVETRRLK